MTSTTFGVIPCYPGGGPGITLHKKKADLILLSRLQVGVPYKRLISSVAGAFILLLLGQIVILILKKGRSHGCLYFVLGWCGGVENLWMNTLN
jgi:hypothetical protein